MVPMLVRLDPPGDLLPEELLVAGPGLLAEDLAVLLPERPDAGGHG
jgi:hypothetical protein